MSRITKDVFAKRLESLRAKMAAQGIDCAIVYSDIWRGNNVAYLADYRQGGGGIGQSWTALLLPLSGKPTIFTGFEETGCAAIQLKIEANIEPSTRFEDVISAHFSKIKPGKIGLIGNSIMLHRVYLAIANASGSAELVDCDLMLARERWVKLPEELDAIRRAFALSDAALEQVIGAIAEGVTEKELFAIGTAHMAKNGCENAFIPTVNIGVNSGIAMKRPSGMSVRRGDLIMLDFGASYEGYTSDTTRTVGYHLDDAYKRGILEAALSAREAGLNVVKPGAKMALLEGAVRDAITAKGYGEYILHNVGHGLGIDSSEEDLPIGPDSDIVMEQGMVFTLEPGIYVPGVGGCRIEECVHVTPDGCEVLSGLRPDYFIE